MQLSVALQLNTGRGSDDVGGMTPGVPKACQTGWFEPSGYRLDDRTGV